MNLTKAADQAASRVDVLIKPSELLGHRALTVYAACASVLATVPGDVVECGVASGETAHGLYQLMVAAKRTEPFDRRVLRLFDVFDECKLAARNNLAASVVATHARPSTEVMNVVIAGSDEQNSVEVVARAGLFEKTLPRASQHQVCFLHADGDLYESTVDIVRFAETSVSRGGVVVFDDYGSEWTGVTRAVDEHLSDRWRTHAVLGTGQLVAVRL